MPKWIVPVVWEASGFIEVEADTAIDACQLVHDYPDDYPLPHDSEYIDASFDISGSVEEAAGLAEIYTRERDAGKWGQRMIFASKESEDPYDYRRNHRHTLSD